MVQIIQINQRIRENRNITTDKNNWHEGVLERSGARMTYGKQ
jgi:hypothetical protein